MAVKPITPTGALYPPCGTDPYFTYVSSGPMHLYLWIIEPKPGAQPYITGHRGVRQRIRYRLRSDYSLCIEQKEPGNTLTHTFKLPHHDIGTTIYLAITEHCSVRFTGTTTPPFPFTYIACAPGADFITVTKSTDSLFTSAGLLDVGWDTVVDGNPALLTGTQVRVVAGGTYRMSWLGTVINSGNAQAGNLSMTLNMFRNAVNVGSFNFPAPGGGAVVGFSCAAETPANIGDDLDFRITVNWNSSNACTLVGGIDGNYAAVQRIG